MLEVFATFAHSPTMPRRGTHGESSLPPLPPHCWSADPWLVFFFFTFFFGELPFLQCLFFVCLLFVRAFDCLLCVALTLFLLCFVSVFFLFFDLPRTFGFSHSLTPSAAHTLLGGCYCRLTVRLARFAYVSGLRPCTLLLFCCCWLGSLLRFFFFLGRKFMLTVLHWKCINLCVYTMCRHSLSRPEGRGWVWYRRKGESHMCLLSTFYGLCPCLCPCPCPCANGRTLHIRA